MVRVSVLLLVSCCSTNSFAGVMHVMPDEDRAPFALYDEVPPIMFPYYRSVDQTEPGYSLLRVFEHEVGHAIGFGHAWSDDQSVVVGKIGDPTLGIGVHVTYSFMATGTPGLNGIVGLDDFMPFGYKTEVRQAFDLWSSICGITFDEIPDFGVPWGMNFPGPVIRIAGLDIDALGIGYYPIPENGNAASDIFLDTSVQWNLGTSALAFSSGDIRGAQAVYGQPAVYYQTLVVTDAVVPETNSFVLGITGALCLLALYLAQSRRCAA